MRGSQHNDKWGKDMSLSEGADGALGGMASGAPIHVRITFKPLVEFLSLKKHSIKSQR